MMKQQWFGIAVVATVAAVALSGCAAEREHSILGDASPSAREQPVVDTDIVGVWQLRRAELAGKPVPTTPGNEFELKVSGNRYSVSSPSGFQDRGRIELFGDELSGQARRMDVIGDVGPNKGRRISALYRIVGRDLEIIYDLSGDNRPLDFVSRDGTKLYLVLYSRKQ